MRYTETIQKRDLVRHLLNGQSSKRQLIGIVGPPGSGKSTLAEQINNEVNSQIPGISAVLPMDGFFYDDSVLASLGLLSRKGAPETFDVDGLLVALDRILGGDKSVALPVFDRDIEIARAGARIISPAVRTVLVEGNYLLLRQAPFDEVMSRLDLTVMLSVDEAVLRERLEARWRGYGLDPVAIRSKVEGNDMPNARLVLSESQPADFQIFNESPWPM